MRMIEITNVVKFYNRIKNDTRIKRWKKFEYVIRKFGEGGGKNHSCMYFCPGHILQYNQRPQ